MKTAKQSSLEKAEKETTVMMELREMQVIHQKKLEEK